MICFFFSRGGDCLISESGLAGELFPSITSYEPVGLTSLLKTVGCDIILTNETCLPGLYYFLDIGSTPIFSMDAVRESATASDSFKIEV